jgi:parallel beta-helix repeat protein
LIGGNAMIDVNSIITTTGNVDVSTLNPAETLGDVIIDNMGNGVIENNGTISIKEGGLAAFVAPTVINNGIITGQARRIELAGSNTRTTIDLYGDGLLEIALDETNNEKLEVINSVSGSIDADGGVIHMTTGAAEDLVNSVINMDGVARAGSATQVGGKIILGGSKTNHVKVAGSASVKGDASKKSIEIASQQKIDVTGTVSAEDADVTITNNADSFDDQIVIATGASVTTSNGDISIDNNGASGGFIVTDGTVTTSNGDIYMKGRQIKLNKNSIVGGDEVTLTGGLVNQNATGVLTADLLKGSVSATAILAGTNNDILALGDFSTGNASFSDGEFTLNDRGGFGIEGNVQTNIGDITLISDGDIGVLNGGAVTKTEGALSITSSTLFDVDSGATIELGTATADIASPTVNLAADINTTGDITGTAATVVIENTTAQIQDGIDVSAVNGRVNVSAGTFTENLTIDKGIEIVGVSRDATILDASGGLNGVTVSADLGTNNVTLEKMAIKNAQRDGVHVAGSANLNNLRLSAMMFENNGWRGSAVFGDSVQGRTQIVNSLFRSNGSLSSANGDGDILFYHHAGNISLGNVGIQGNTGGAADYGVQIIGSPTKTESGTIVLNNLNVSGQYRVANLGIQQYDGLKSLSMNNVKLGGQTSAGNNSVSTAGWGGALFLSNLGEANLDLGNTEFRAHDTNYIVLGAYNLNTEFTNTNIDATDATFLGKLGSEMSLAENFAVEDKVNHKMDFAPFGLVTWNTGNLYATQQSETGFAGVIQRGVDASDVNGNIWVEDGNFAGDINVNKSVQLYGAQNGVDARGRTGVPETVIVPNSPGMTITANNVLVDGFTVENGTNGIVVDGADNVQLLSNIVNNNTDTNAGRSASNWKTGVGIIVKDGASNVTVRHNSADGNTDGIRVVESGAGIIVEENDVDNSADKGIIIKQTNGAQVLDNDLEGNRQGIRVNIADNTVVRDNVIDNSTNEAIHVDGGSDGTRMVDNMITTAKTGIRIQGGQNNFVDDNTIRNFDVSGVTVDGSTNTDVIDNLIESTQTGAVGILVDGATNTQVGGIGNTLRNRINDVDTGVDVQGGTNTVVEGNDIQDTMTGVLASASSGLEVLNNTISRATSTGVDVTNSNSAQIVDNVVKDSRTGISVTGGTDAFIDDNEVNNFDDRGIVLNGTAGADVIDNYIISTKTNTVGIDLVDTIDTQVGGDGNTLRNRIYDVTKGVQLARDSQTTIDGNDFQRTGTGISSDISSATNTSTDLVITDNTFENGGMAMFIANADGVLIGGRNDANFITNNGGITVSNSDNAEILRNRLSFAQGTGITVVNGDNVRVERNVVNDTQGNALTVIGGDNANIERNRIRRSTGNGITVQNTINATVDNNLVRRSGTAGIVVDGATGTNVVDNRLGRNAVGAEVRGFGGLGLPSDNTSFSGNVITDSTVAGVKTTGDSVGSVKLISNELDNNAIGMLLEGGEIDISDLLNPNTINGGNTAMRFDGAEVSLENNTLGATIFDGTLGNYVELANGALFAPGAPTNIDGLAASFDGLIPLNSDLGPGLIRATDRTRIENKIVDFDDNTTLGQIIVGLDLNASEEDIFGLNLFSLQPENLNVSVTFRGLPPVTAPDIATLANLETAAGGDGEQSAEDFANLEPAAGGEEGCWAAIGQGGDINGNMTFSFGGGIDDAISDSACASGI